MRIYGVEIKNNPILGDIDLDFTDKEGNIVDTIIFAGENGCGKTTLLDCLTVFNNASSLAENETRHFYLEIDSLLSDKLLDAMFSKDKPNTPIVKADYLIKKQAGNTRVIAKYFIDVEMKQSIGFSYAINGDCIYLTPEITFTPDPINTISAKNIDIPLNGLRKSGTKIATEITQLIIDIATQDNSEFSEKYRKEHRADYTEEQMSPRITRFNKAFSKIVPNFHIETINNVDGHKVVIFYNKGQKVPISRLSSGEKQIVFRGGYLLKDKNTLKGALVIIDEPELSLHPEWQKKILDYYKAIFTNESGQQTSQMFIATHSPYIIHNENRKNDKVIVLKKDNNATITIMDKPEYYSCGDIKVIEDAFNDKLFIIESSPTVYLEGRTDEKYFNKALEVFSITPSWKFKWIGYLDSNGQERNTGKDNLNKVQDFLISQNLSIKNICLFDNDTNKHHEVYNNIISYAITQYNSSKNIKRGIENALILDDINLEDYYIRKESVSDYGEIKIISTLEKMRLCNDICSKSNNELKPVFTNLKVEIEKIDKLIKGES